MCGKASPSETTLKPSWIKIRRESMDMAITPLGWAGGLGELVLRHGHDQVDQATHLAVDGGITLFQRLARRRPGYSITQVGEQRLPLLGSHLPIDEEIEEVV